MCTAAFILGAFIATPFGFLAGALCTAAKLGEAYRSNPEEDEDYL